MYKIKGLSIATVGLALVTLTGSAFASGTTPLTAPDPAWQMTDQDQGQEAEYKHKKLRVNQELLNLLKVDAKTFRQELESGKSLADIAAVHGVQKQQVIDLLVKQVSQRIDQAVKSGNLTQDQANQKKANLQEKIKQCVEHKGSWHHKGKHSGKGYLKDAAAVLGMEKKELVSELRSGKSLVEIAKSKGISKEQLVNKLLDKDKERINKMIEHKWNQNKK